MSGCVLLTGASGFLGSHLMEMLLNNNYKVVIVKRSTSNVWRIEHLLSDVISVDIDKTSLDEAFQAVEIDTVIHTACSYGRRNERLLDIVDSNLMLGLNILETALRYKTRYFINTATTLPNTLNAYALSKHQFGEWLKFKSDSIHAVDVKVEHMYGPRDDNQKFIPWLLDQMTGSESVIPLTAGEQKRDFVYIDDVVSAYLTILNNRSRLSAWSEFKVASAKPVRMKELVLALATIVEQDTQTDIVSRLNFGAIAYRTGEVMECEVDISAIRSLGWRANVELNAGLQNVYSNYKQLRKI